MEALSLETISIIFLKLPRAFYHVLLQQAAGAGLAVAKDGLSHSRMLSQRHWPAVHLNAAP